MTSLKKQYPKIHGHVDSLKNHQYFASTSLVIDENLNGYTNTCPHRGFPIVTPSTVSTNMRCALHGWEWDSQGNPTNNSVCLKPRKLETGRSGLIFTDWQEPSDAKWVNDLANDDFEYSHSTRRTGRGDWRWQMDMHVDLLHVDKIHPLLNGYVDVNNLKTEYGPDWVCQHHAHGWWLFIYPFTHIEWEPGCLYFSEMVPNHDWANGYEVYIHYMFNKSVPQHVKDNFIAMAEVTFDEDVKAVDELSANSRYRKPRNDLDPLEVDTLHFYEWLEANVLQE